jgi:hypothetical protein
VPDLPQATFDLVLTSLGPDAARVLTAELSYIQSDILEKQHEHDRYNADSFGAFRDEDLDKEREELHYKKIHRLSTVPGGLDAAIEFLVQDVARCAPCLVSNEAYDACETADFRLQEFIERKLSHADKHGPRWCASRCMKQAKQLALYTDLSRMHWASENGLYIPSLREVFARTHVVLETWHSREVGEMLAEKVAGHLLPPELVELVGEAMYETERWQSRAICTPYAHREDWEDEDVFSFDTEQHQSEMRRLAS